MLIISSIQVVLPFRSRFAGHIFVNKSVWFHIIMYSGFGGLEVARWPLVPKIAGSNPTEAVGFLRVNKKILSTSGGMEVLSVVIVVCCQVEVSAAN